VPTTSSVQSFRHIEACDRQTDTHTHTHRATADTLLAQRGVSKNSIIGAYDTRCYFNVRSKADMSQLNLVHDQFN